MTLPALCVADLQQLDAEGEPLLHDLRLAERLGYAQPRDIRKLIKRNRKKLERYGRLRQHGATSHEGSGAREVDEYWLNKRQSIRLTTLAETQFAEEATAEIIEVYMAWHEGKLHPRAGTQVVWTDEAVREVLGHTAANSRAIGELQQTTKRLEDKVDNVIDMVTRQPYRQQKPPFNESDWEQWRQTLQYDYGGYDPSVPRSAAVKFLDDNWQWRIDIDIEGHHPNPEKGGALNGLPVLKQKNADLKDYDTRKVELHFFETFRANVKARFPNGLKKKRYIGRFKLKTGTKRKASGTISCKAQCNLFS